ncbi:MAG: TonB-dependent receptor [Saprospiraceae bacterium]|nr:TonB-dependent receptor [Saprospiraceae bacterium]
MKQLVQRFGLFLLVCSQFLAESKANTVVDATVLSVSEVRVAATVKGKITAENGDPLVGASVVVKGTTNGTITDLDGNFSLSVPNEKSILVISFVGHNTQEIVVGNQTEINVTMTESGALSEVVVVGYGTQKKSQTTGAISSLNSRQLTEMPVTNLAQALQGRVAGVDVAQSGSKPGATPTIRVRGRRSFRASNDPLYVVDGVPLSGTPGFGTPGFGNAGATTGYEDLNPNDVQSMEILKDATATAIYGARGANGVILITTKRGALAGQKKTTISYDAYVGQTSALDKVKLFTGPEFAEYIRESRRGIASGSTYKDANGVPVPSGKSDAFADSKLFEAVEIEGIAQGRTTDYQDMLLKSGMQQSHSLGVQGGNEKTAFYISGSYFQDKGISVGLDYSRMSLRANVDHHINDNLKVGLSTYAMYSLRNGENLNPYSFTISQNPLARATDDAGNLIFAQTSDALLTNPLFEIIPGAQVDEAKRYRILNSLYADLKIMDGLNYRVNFGPDMTIQRNGRFIGSATNALKGGAPIGSIRNQFGFNWVLENIVTYTKAFGKHNLGLTALHSFQKDNFEISGISAQGIPAESQSFLSLGNASSVLGVGSALIERKINSFMGRVNYDYADKYLLTATLRRDGASPFGVNTKYGNFPGLALGWNVHNEDFLKDVKWLDVLKVRASLGVVGNQAVAPYQTQGLLSRTAYAWGTTAAFGQRPSTIGNPDLQWEESTTRNVGVDFSFFKGRVNGTLEAYQVNTTDLLLADQLPTSVGFSSVTRNVGETQNKGIELSLSTVNIDRGGFKWTTDFIFTKNNEQIISLYNGAVDDPGNGWFIGKPLSAYFNLKKDGIWQLGEEDKAKSYGSRVGQIKVNDNNGRGADGKLTGQPDGKINADDRTFIGSEIPDWSGGVTSRFSFKGIDFSIILYARMGQTILSGFHRNNNALAGRYQQIKVDYWTPNNPTNEFPQPNKDQEFPVNNQTLIYFDGSFVKIRNINFGYTLPTSLTKKMGVESLRVFSSIQQPKIWSQYRDKYNGIDPEVNESGTLGNNVTPATKVFTVGVNVKF